eukprot:Sdes_comp14985_c0_seq1m3721
MNGDHLQHGVSGRKPLAHDGFHESFSLQVSFFDGKFDADHVEDFIEFFFVEFDGGVKHFVDWVQDKLVESTNESFSTSFVPFLGLSVEKVVAPESFHQLFGIHAKLISIHFRKLFQSESPSMKTRPKRNSAARRIHHNVSHGAIFGISIGGNNDVDGLDNTLKGLEQIFLLQLQLQQGTIHFVHVENRFDALSNRLTKHSFGLDTHARNTINNDKRAISHTESSCDFGGEVNVPGGINQINEKSISFLFLFNIGQISLAQFVVEGNGGGFDGDAAILFVLTRIREPGFSCFGSSNNTSFGDQRVSQGRFSVIDVSNH